MEADLFVFLERTWERLRHVNAVLSPVLSGFREHSHRPQDSGVMECRSRGYLGSPSVSTHGTAAMPSSVFAPGRCQANRPPTCVYNKCAYGGLCAGKGFWSDHDKKGCEELNSTLLCVSEHFTGNTDCIKQTFLGMVDSLPIPKEA